MLGQDSISCPSEMDLSNDKVYREIAVSYCATSAVLGLNDQHKSRDIISFTLFTIETVTTMT